MTIFETMRVNRQALSLLKKYGIRACAVEPNTPLATLLAAQPDWELAYRDNICALYIRKSTEPTQEGLTHAIYQSDVGVSGQ